MSNLTQETVTSLVRGSQEPDHKQGRSRRVFLLVRLMRRLGVFLASRTTGSRQRELSALSAQQLDDAGIPPERAGRGRAADVDAATIANLEAMR